MLISPRWVDLFEVFWQVLIFQAIFRQSCLKINLKSQDASISNCLSDRVDV